MKVLIGVLLFVSPQLVGLAIYFWRSRHNDPRARLWGVILPTLIAALPLLLVLHPKPGVPGKLSVSEDGDGGASLLFIFVAVFHFTVAFVGHLVAHVLMGSHGKNDIVLGLHTRRPN